MIQKVGKWQFKVFSFEELEEKYHKIDDFVSLSVLKHELTYVEKQMEQNKDKCEFLSIRKAMLQTKADQIRRDFRDKTLK